MTSRSETSLFIINAPFNYFMTSQAICRAPRVVGIDTGTEVLWSPKNLPGRTDLNYARKRIEEVAVASDGLFHERLVGFFATYLAKESGGHKKEYNCHLFGRWMIGESLATPENGTDGPEEVINVGIRTAIVEWGQRGVIGGLWRKKPDPAHSVIGLGGDSAIHVEGWQGPLRITSPQEAVNKYVSPYHQRDPGYKGGIYISAEK
jgi:hypothetical protein